MTSAELHQSAPDRTTGYARDVVDGCIVAGELVIAACRRHLQDLIDGPARGLRWDADRAEAIIDSFPAFFTITDGPDAGEPFELLDWMIFATGSMFGWYRGDRLRFDTAHLETAKGQGKSPWMACLGLLATGALGRARPQVYAIAPKQDQAAVLFKDAAAAIRSQVPGEDEGVTLESLGKFKVRGLLDNAHKIEHPKSGGVFTTVSGNASRVSGPRPFVVLLDEVHELASRALVDMWIAALAKSAEGGILVMCTNTPAQTQFVGSEFSEAAIRVVTGLDVSDTLFVLIYRVDIADRATVFDHPEVWPKAMPALGITFPVENIEREVAKARLNPSERARVERLYMGIPTGAVDFWLDDPTMWDRAVRPVDDLAQVGRKCWLALDLSDKHDLTSLTIVWEDWVETSPGVAVQMLISKTWFWTCSANLERRARTDRMPYDVWRDKGQINVVAGDAITKDFVAVFVAELFATHLIDALVFDVAGMAAFREACDRVGLDTWLYEGPDTRPGKGLKLVRHSQGTRRAMKGDQLDMPTSIEALEDCLRLGTTTIDDSPVMYACAANAAPVTDATGNRAFDKKRSRGRIDGLVTLAMAHGAAKMSARTKAPSNYAKRGVLIL